MSLTPRRANRPKYIRGRLDGQAAPRRRATPRGIRQPAGSGPRSCRAAAPTPPAPHPTGPSRPALDEKSPARQSVAVRPSRRACSPNTVRGRRHQPPTPMIQRHRLHVVPPPPPPTDHPAAKSGGQSARACSAKSGRSEVIPSMPISTSDRISSSRLGVHALIKMPSWWHRVM